MWTLQTVQLYNFIQIGWCSGITILFTLALVLDKSAQEAEVHYMTIIYSISTHLLLLTINVVMLSISLWCRWWDDNDNDFEIMRRLHLKREVIQNSVIFVWMILLIGIYGIVSMFATYWVWSGSMQFVFNGSLLFVIVLFFTIVGLMLTLVFLVTFCCSCSCCLVQTQQPQEEQDEESHNPFEIQLLNLSQHGVPTKESMSTLQGVAYQNRLNELWEEQLNQNTEVNCPICYTSLFTLVESPGSKVTVLSCKHCYHEKCIEAWVIQNNHVRCPVCRQKIAQRIIP